MSAFETLQLNELNVTDQQMNVVCNRNLVVVFVIWNPGADTTISECTATTPAF
jgi:hypothetical protein